MFDDLNFISNDFCSFRSEWKIFFDLLFIVFLGIFLIEDAILLIVFSDASKTLLTIAAIEQKSRIRAGLAILAIFKIETIVAIDGFVRLFTTV